MSNFRSLLDKLNEADPNYKSVLDPSKYSADQARNMGLIGDKEWAKRKETEQGLEPIRPEEWMIGGPVKGVRTTGSILKGIASAEKSAARAGSDIMKGLRGTPKPPTTPPVVTPSGVTPTIPPNVNIPAVIRNRPGQTTAPTTAPTTASTTAPTASTTAPTTAARTPKPKIDRRPGETTAAAVKRAQAELPKPDAGSFPPKPGGPSVWKFPGKETRRSAEIERGLNEPIRGFGPRPPPEEPLFPTPQPGKPGSVTKQRRKLMVPPVAPDNDKSGASKDPGGKDGGSGAAAPSSATGGTSSKQDNRDWDKDVVYPTLVPDTGKSKIDLPTATSTSPANKTEPVTPPAQPAASEPQKSTAEPTPQPTPSQSSTTTPTKPTTSAAPASEPGKDVSQAGQGTGTGTGTGSGSADKSKSKMDPLDWLKRQGIDENKNIKKLTRQFERFVNRFGS